MKEARASSASPSGKRSRRARLRNCKRSSCAAAMYSSATYPAITRPGCAPLSTSHRAAMLHIVEQEREQHEEESLFPWSPFARVMVVQAAHAAGDALVAISLAGTLF